MAAPWSIPYGLSHKVNLHHMQSQGAWPWKSIWYRPSGTGLRYHASMATTKGSRSPRYVGIAADIRERILSRQLGPHALLPSERELSEKYGVSRMTARQALTVLESEGHVYRRPPRGTFVAEPRVRFHIGSFTQEATRLGHQAHAQLLWAKKAPPDPQARTALELPEDGLVHAFRRLRLMEEEPIALETTY